jgi:hypothetical protein
MKNNEMERTLARMTEMRNIFKILIGKSEGKRLFGRPRSGWDLREKQ